MVERILFKCDEFVYIKVGNGISNMPIGINEFTNHITHLDNIVPLCDYYNKSGDRFKCYYETDNGYIILKTGDGFAIRNVKFYTKSYLSNNIKILKKI